MGQETVKYGVSVGGGPLFLFDTYMGLMVSGLLGSGDIEIYSVRVLPAEHYTPESERYWAYWSKEENAFLYVYKKKFQVKLCDPYGFSKEIEAGLGKVMQVYLDKQKLSQEARRELSGTLRRNVK